MMTTKNRIWHNIRIFWVGIVIIIIAVITRFNTQTASLTDVIHENSSSIADMSLTQQGSNTILSTLKKYESLQNATLLITFFVQEGREQAFENSLQSSYWFFVTNHHNTSTVTIYLPEKLDINEKILTFTDSWESVIDSIILFQWDQMDNIRLDQKKYSEIHGI